jgi:hypothetical protein
MVSRGGMLADLGRRDDALAAFDRTIVRFQEEHAPVVRERAARALTGRA